MKINNTTEDPFLKKEKSKKKKKLKKKLKKKIKSKKLSLSKESVRIIQNPNESTSSFCSFDNTSFINENDSRITLTPSKSENDDADKTLTEENACYTYNSIVDEFIDDGGAEAKIVSPPSICVTESPIVTTLEVENFENKETCVKKDKKKSKKRKLETLIETENDVANDNFIEEDSEETRQYFYTTDGVVVVLAERDILSFYGLMSVSVLHGEIEILGYTVTKNCQDVKLYSPRGGSLLTLKNITTSNVSVANYLTNLNIFNQIHFIDNCAIILCKKLEDNSISFIEKHVSQQILLKSDGTHLPRVTFQPSGMWNVFQSNEEWNVVIDKVDQTSKLMFCGGKGVGKSTFLRYAINRLLTKFDEVQVIDLDPGQSEFTIPGCISIVKISEPIFGPNYTHLKKPERSILSNINVGHEPAIYIESVKYLLKGAMSKVPTLINYMGFTHGTGINILSAIVMHLEPTDIVQIESRNSKKNYRFQLTKDVILKNAEMFLQVEATSFVNLDYRLHLISSMCDQNDGWTAEARQLREMNILAYISQMTDSNSILNSKAPMYSVGLEHITLSDVNGQTIHPAAVNASLVALCSLTKNLSNIFECLGWGIVRGIDVVSNTLILLTLERESVLDKVSHLVLNSAPLPPSIYMTPDEVIGQIPYVMEGMLMSFGQIPKRSRVSVRNKE